MSLKKYKDQPFTVQITDLNNLGYGVCRVDGIATFVGGAVDGDTAKIKIIKTARDYMVACVLEIIEPSQFRIQPECPASRKCGGCVYGGITYEHELELKRRYVEGAMRKNRLDVTVAPVICDGRVWGWRNKVQYPVGENFEIGYYRRHTHELSGIADCGLEVPPLRGIAPFIAERLKKYDISARHIYLRCGEGTGEVMACVVTRSAAFPHADEFVRALTEKFPAIVGVLQNINPDDTNVVLGERWKLLWGREYIEDTLCGCRFRLSPQSFYQVNRGCAEILYRHAAELTFGYVAGTSDSHAPSGASGQAFRLADLYCGAGTIGICAASMRPGVKLTGIEITPEAVENAAYNARVNGIEDAEFICAEIGDDFKLPEAVQLADAVIVDPPRKGLAAGLIEALANAGVRRVVYISCNPDTLARDMALFIQRGYASSTVTPVDMFPRTGHVECVTLMSKVEK
jgi:23S rRNA (uracil1939-C5)-methyltransferase